MPGPLVMIPSLIVGVILAMWGRLSWTNPPEDKLLFFLGLALGGIIGWSVAEPWFALGIVVVAPLILLRRRKVRG
jgi:hypothetical protein